MFKPLRRLRLSVLRALLSGKCSVPDAVVVASSPRSGSTWLGQILSAIPGSSILFEPLHLNYVSEAKEAGFYWRTYVPPETPWPEGKAFLTQVFDGRVLNWWTAQETTLRSALSARFLVVKFVRATRLLPWMCRNFPFRAPLLLVRHPCAVVASQMRSESDWKDPSRPLIPSYLDTRPDLRRVIERLQTREEFLAAEWALDYVPALTAPGPRPWQVVSYEELLVRTEPTIDRVFAAWGQEIPAGVWAKVRAPSRMTWKSGMSGLDGWKRQLDPGQVRRILDVAAAFGLNFYGTDPEPDYDLLHSPDASGAVAAADTGAPPTRVGQDPFRHDRLRRGSAARPAAALSVPARR